MNKESSKNSEINQEGAPELAQSSADADGYLLSDFSPRAKRIGEGVPDGNLARRSDLAAGFYWDRELPGFGLRVYSSGQRRWIVQLRQRGATRRITLGEPDSMKAPAARAAARAVLAQNALDGLPVRPSRTLRNDPRFAAFVPEFWRDYSRHWKCSTQARNRQSIDRTLTPYFGRRHVGTLTRADILAWRDTLHDRQGTFNRDLPVLAAILGYAEKLGYRPKGSNPCKGIARYKRDLPERFLTEKEYRRVGATLAEAEDELPEAVAAIRLLLYTGARCAEIAALRWEWIDPPYVFLPDSKTGPKRLYLNRQSLSVIETRERGARTGALFPDIEARPRLLPSAWQMLKRRAGLPDVRLHDLRHSFASVAVMDGVSLARVGKLLGHALPETTARYAHLADDVVSEAADRVCASIAASLGGLS